MADHYNKSTRPPPKFDDDKQKERSDEAEAAWETESSSADEGTQLAKDKVSSTAFTSSDLTDTNAIPSSKEARYGDGPTEQMDEKWATPVFNQQSDEH